jgi:hypothetical protein
MTHLIPYQKPHKQHGKKNSDQGGSQVHKIDAGNITLLGNKLMGIVYRVLQQNCCQSAYYANEKAEQVNQLPVIQASR